MCVMWICCKITLVNVPGATSRTPKQHRNRLLFEGYPDNVGTLKKVQRLIAYSVRDLTALLEAGACFKLRSVGGFEFLRRIDQLCNSVLAKPVRNAPIIAFDAFFSCRFL